MQVVYVKSDNDNHLDIKLPPLSKEEEIKLEKLEKEYLKEIQIDRNCGSNPKYQIYFAYIRRWRYNNKK
jgi:hypothetical protein